jgi:hypothetical protein
LTLHKFSYRFAQEVLENSPAFQPAYNEIMDVFSRLVPLSRIGGNARFPIDQKRMNKWIDGQFRSIPGWEYHPRITDNTKLEGDFKKDRIQIEVQFGNMARWTYDILKFQITYSQGIVDIGVLVVPMRWFAGLIGDNVVYYERVLRELPHAKLSITLPILVLGLEPDDPETLSLRSRGLSQAAPIDAPGDESRIEPTSDV